MGSGASDGATTVAAAPIEPFPPPPEQAPALSEMARAPMTPTQAPTEHHQGFDEKRKSGVATVKNDKSARQKKHNKEDAASPNDTEVDEEDVDIYDDCGSMLGSDDDLGTPLGVGGPAGFGEFDEEEFASHRFMGPSVPGNATSARALHGLRRVMVHDKPPKMASEAASMRASFTGSRPSLAVSRPSSFTGRTSSVASDGTVSSSIRSYSLETQPFNAYQVTFSERNSTGFTTRLSISERTAELAVRVATVERDSPAFKAGVVVGDTLISINDNLIEPHMTEDQVDELLESQRGSRTIVFTRPCVDSPLPHPRSKSEGVTGSFGSDSDPSEKKPAKGRFSKVKLGSALSYGGSLMASKLKRKKPVVHKGVMCDGCGVDSISGALWSCSVCPNYNLCNDCYECGTHGMENSEAVQTLNEALVQYRLQKKCKRFTPEFLLSLRRDICKNRPDKFEYMGSWIADIVNGTAPSKIKVRGIEIPHLPATSRQRFVGKLMPLMSNRTDIEVNIEWLPDDSERMSMADVVRVSERGSGSVSSEDLEKLRIWISDKKTRTASPFA